MRVNFHGLSFDLPPGWLDITDDLPEGAPPSLARPDGVGVLQFSLARYSGGEEPTVTIEGLRHLTRDFFRRHAMEYALIEEGSGSATFVHAGTMGGESPVWVWYASNDRDVLLATYVHDGGNSSEVDAELADARAMIGSLAFT